MSGARQYIVNTKTVCRDAEITLLVSFWLSLLRTRVPEELGLCAHVSTEVKRVASAAAMWLFLVSRVNWLFFVRDGGTCTCGKGQGRPMGSGSWMTSGIVSDAAWRVNHDKIGGGAWRYRDAVGSDQG